MTTPNFPDLNCQRFQIQAGFLIAVQTPEASVDALKNAVLGVVSLAYGDYDQVAFCSPPGQQQFRSLGTGRNDATQSAVSVACCELRFFAGQDSQDLQAVMLALYDAHPYEEPVIFVTPCLRSLHVRGTDEDNPNRFWNRQDEPEVQAWLPPEHR